MKAPALVCAVWFAFGAVAATATTLHVVGAAFRTSLDNVEAAERRARTQLDTLEAMRLQLERDQRALRTSHGQVSRAAAQLSPQVCPEPVRARTSTP